MQTSTNDSKQTFEVKLDKLEGQIAQSHTPAFPGTKRSLYWTSTVYKYSKMFAETINFESGKHESTIKSDRGYIRLVRVDK